jgi:hypothetical protein
MKDKLKNTLEHEVELLGRSISILALAGLLLIGGGSAALLTSFGTVSGEADVTQAVLVNGQNDKTNPSDLVSSSDGHVAGTYFVSDLNSDDSKTMTIASQTESPVTVELDTEYAEGSSPNSYSDSFEGVTAHNIVYNTPEYDPDSDIVVDESEGDDYKSIQEAINNEVTDGEDVTIYVEPGTYSSFQITGVAADVTVRSTEGVEDTEIQLSSDRIDIGNQAEFELNGFKVTGNPSNHVSAVFKDSGGITATTGSEERFVIKNNAFVSDTYEGDGAGRAVVVMGGVDRILVEDNFFSSEDDSHLELARGSNGNPDVDIIGNTFAEGDITELYFPNGLEDGDYSSVDVKDNNFLSTSGSGISTNEDVSSPIDVNFDSNYFDQVATKIDSADYSDQDLSPSEEPYSGGEVALSAGESVEVTQLTYLDIALGGDDSYSLKTSVNPVR